MNLSDKYPKLFEKLEDKELELRHLLSIDENELDYDSEEFEFDVEEYNYIIYLAEPITKLFDEARLHKFIQDLGDDKAVFEDFFASEEDLYGVKSALSKEEIADVILRRVEEMV